MGRRASALPAPKVGYRLTEMSEITPLFLERRFPLGLDTVLPDIRALYETSKAAHWDPQVDLPWNSFAPDNYTAVQLRAAQLSWSRRAWVEYTALAETPSLLVRFCLERGREADPKFYLTVRNTEEAWHIECCHRFAEQCGGYVEQPLDSAYAQSLNRNFHREVLHADTPLDAYVAAHCALSDSLEYALWESYATNATDPLAKAILSRATRDKSRHAQFGWLYLSSRQASWDASVRDQIETYVVRHVDEVELAGYHCVSLGVEAEVSAICEADAISAEAGLGSLAPETERLLTAKCLHDCSQRFASLGLQIAAPDDPRLLGSNGADEHRP